MCGKFVQPSDASIDNLQAVAEVGPTRAMRFRRDTSISTIRDLAQASIDELTQVWSVGTTRAAQIKGSAQGWISQLRKLRQDLGGSKRVAIVCDGRGQDINGNDRPDALTLLEQTRDDNPRKVIDDAIDQLEIGLEDDDEVALVSNGECGGDHVSQWLQYKQMFGENLQRRIIDTPWDKYRPWIEGDERPSTGNIPFDFVEQPDDVHWGLAPMERNKELAQWADVVVIVVDSGIYAPGIRRQCKYEDTECKTFLEVTNDGGDDETPLGVNEYSPDPELHVYEPDEDETVANSTTTDRPSTVGEAPSRDEPFIDGAFDGDDQRVQDRDDITKADPGGSGLGTNKNRWA